MHFQLLLSEDFKIILSFSQKNASPILLGFLNFSTFVLPSIREKNEKKKPAWYTGKSAGDQELEKCISGLRTAANCIF